MSKQKQTLIENQIGFTSMYGMATRVPYPDFESKGLPPCRTTDAEIYFPEVGTSQNPQDVKVAKRLCNDECPYKAECLQYAVDTSQEFGIWGGTTQKMRRRIRRQPEQIARRKELAAKHLQESKRQCRRDLEMRRQEEFADELEKNQQAA